MGFLLVMSYIIIRNIIIAPAVALNRQECWGGKKIGNTYDLETQYTEGKFVGLEVTAASEGLNTFSAAHFMLIITVKREKRVPK